MPSILILPTFNEKVNIELLIPRIFSILPDISILVVDDNSPDGTGDAVMRLQKTYPHLELLPRKKKEGLGTAYIEAFRHVLKKENIHHVIMMDADFSHDPAYLPALITQAQSAQVVVGSRYVSGGKIEGWELWRRILSLCGNFYCRAITRLPISDCTGGYNIIATEMLRKLDFDEMDSSGYAFIMELKYMIFRAGATFSEVPIMFKNRLGGESKISNHVIREGILAPWKMVLKKR